MCLRGVIHLRGEIRLRLMCLRNVSSRLRSRTRPDRNVSSKCVFVCGRKTACPSAHTMYRGENKKCLKPPPECIIDWETTTNRVVMLVHHTCKDKDSRKAEASSTTAFSWLLFWSWRFSARKAVKKLVDFNIIQIIPSEGDLVYMSCSSSWCKGFLGLPQVIMAKQIKKYLKTLKNKMNHILKIPLMQL